jgi:hypothetical protein
MLPPIFAGVALALFAAFYLLFYRRWQEIVSKGKPKKP